MFVQVALNLPLDKFFTYSVPDYLRETALPGKRVVVSFGRKVVTGIIVTVEMETTLDKVKPISSILDEEPVVTDKMFEFAKWMSGYYLTSLGECLFLSIPRNVNIRSENYYKLTENYIDEFDKLKKDNELFVKVIRAFEESSDEYLSRNQIEKKLNTNDASNLLSNLVSSKILYKHLLYKKPTREKFIKIFKRNFEVDELQKIITESKIRSEKQKQVLRLLCDFDEMTKKDLLSASGITSSSLDSLILKELVVYNEVREYRVSREGFNELHSVIVMNDEQRTAFEKISACASEKKFKTFLLHGVTGSGKTEVYLNIIEEVLKSGRTAIVLVPEISLTPQLINRFGNRFADLVGVIHSRLSDGERLDTFDSIRSGKIKIIIGARSALFSPLENPGVIIIDEEHDSSYKQENSPRYHARDSAIMKGKLFECPVVLGSATPSVESYHNAKAGKYELLQLTKRPDEITQPEIVIIDLQKRDKEAIEEMLSSRTNKVQQDFFEFIDKVRLKFLSKELIVEIDERLDKKESIILLQNRRGFHSYTECIDCKNVEMCPRCSISLTYHKTFHKLKCHFCGYSRNFTGICSACNSQRLIPKGAGTEKVEEEISNLFPRAVVERMDSDSVSSKKNFKRILQDFYDGKIDILVGTQMISKGLDFPNVTLVGVVNADIGLLNPDFRATERTFQILTQVAGRSGRSKKKGEVVIQTNHADYDVFRDVKNHDFESFFNRELAQRKQVLYPPFSRLILVEIKSTDRLLADSKIKEVYNLLLHLDKEKIAEVFPPIIPLFSKLKDKYRFHLILKCNKSKDPTGFKMNNILRKIKLHAEQNFSRQLQLIIDVDVVNLM